MRCLNCDRELYDGSYCCNCGQRNVHQRLRFNDLLEDLKSQILEVNLPWLYTIRELSRRPGQVCREYVEGRRIRYVNPLKYVLFVTAIAGFLLLLLPQEFQSPLTNMPAWKLARQSAVDRFFTEHFIILMLLLTPLIAPLLRIAFRKKQYNHTEIYCFVFFITGHNAMLYLVTASFFVLLDRFLTGVGFAIDGLYLSFYFFSPTVSILQISYLWLAAVGFFVQNVFYTLLAVLGISLVYVSLIILIADGLLDIL